MDTTAQYNQQLPTGQASSHQGAVRSPTAGSTCAPGRLSPGKRPADATLESTVGRRSVLSAGAGITAAVAGGSLVGRWLPAAAAEPARAAQPDSGDVSAMPAQAGHNTLAPIRFGFAAQDSRGLPTEIILDLPQAAVSGGGSLQLTIHARELDAVGLVTQRSALKPVVHDGQRNVPGTWPAPLSTGSGDGFGSSSGDGLMSSSSAGAQGSAGQAGDFRGVTVFDLGSPNAGRTELLVHWEGAPSAQRMQIVATLVVRNERQEFEQYQTNEVLSAGSGGA